VAASSNRLAHAAPRRWPKHWSVYNPLFIYGTRDWARPICSRHRNYVTENYPRRKVLYVTTETFMNDFVDSLRTRHLTFNGATGNVTSC